MGSHVARRLRFRNGERTSILMRRGGLPEHVAVLFLNRYRTRGRAANTIHMVCSCIALLHNELDAAGIDILERFGEGRFLTLPEVERFAQAAQYKVDDRAQDARVYSRSNVVNLERVRMRQRRQQEREPVDPATHANRLRYSREYLRFLVDYVKPTLAAAQAQALEREAKRGLDALDANVPRVTTRAKLGSRQGLSKEEQDRLLEVVHPNSPTNPWKQAYVRVRNWLMVVVLLATGMRRGELLGLQIRDLNPREPKLRIVRRADAVEDARRHQPNPKTYDREIELSPSVMKALWSYINRDRHAIRAARRVPQIFVSDEGKPLSLDSVDKLFRQLREACPDLPVVLTSHVMRHSWNERFSEQADEMGLPAPVEEKARATQQGWSENSKTAAVYTRRHNERKGREVALRLQEKLEGKLDGSK